MTVTPETLPTVDVTFGGKPKDRIIGGDSYDRELLFRDLTEDPVVPIDFSNFVQTAEFIDEDGNVIPGTSVVVTPSPGDATGIIQLQVTAAITTTLLAFGDGKSRIAIRGTFGLLRKTWICGRFIVEAC